MSALTVARAVTSALTALGFGFIALSIATGDISAEGSIIADLPWGRMSLVDIYLGVALITLWVFLREDRTWVAVAWIPVFIVLGHAGTALYAAVAAFRATTVEEFLLGARQRKG